MTKRMASCISLPTAVFLLKEHIESFEMLIGTLSLLCSVLPPSISLEATALRAVASAMPPWAHTYKSRQLIVKVSLFHLNIMTLHINQVNLK